MSKNTNRESGENNLRVPQDFFRRIASIITDEINNALSTLAMNLSRIQLQQRRNPDVRISDVADSITAIEQRITRIKGTAIAIAEVLVKWGEEKVEFGPVDLDRLIHDTTALVNREIGKDHIKKIKVESDIPEDVGPIRGHFKMLQEVFLNLLVNAYEAMEDRPDGLIRITVEKSSKDSSHATVHFTDNGSGVAKDIASKIFHYGVTNKKKRLVRAISLFTCKQIIELHSGSIGAESKLGEGTKMTVRLPLIGKARHSA